MAKVPVPTLNHVDPVINRQTGHLKDAIDQLGSQTQDDWKDGTRFRRVTGVNYANQVTSSGIAPYSIVAANIGSGVLLGSNIAPLTISGALLTDQTVTLGKLAPCNQFSVYRDTAFSAGAVAFSPLIANKVVKDVGNGYSTSNGIYTIPSGGDWQFQWSVGLSALAANSELYSALTINSGANKVTGNRGFASTAGILMTSVGSYLYANASANETIRLDVWNGDGTPRAMSVGSGANYFQGYQLR